MSELLTLADFPAFFQALNGGRSPFPWQEELAAQVCAGTWPEVMALPTGTGKTSCLDIAVFAMALRRSGPRRVFYVVDRRVVVDQAFERMQKICRALREARDGVLGLVRARLEALGGVPDAFSLRGGIYRDDSWVRSPAQPLLIASTVDQVGSRLLFRGYGASPHTWPIHAALAGNDALILLDEAHCSAAFEKTVKRMARYRRMAAEPLETPFAFVRLTATPGEPEGAVFGLGERDLAQAELSKRLRTRKPARLMVVNARAKEWEKVARALTEEAEALAGEPRLRRIAIIANRVRTAKGVYRLLRERGHKAHLMIGRMRPLDRDTVQRDLAGMKSGVARQESEAVFVVATQCIEVGADLDFDGLVTECASIDALLQRFGRLDRTGELEGAARGRIVIASHQTEDKYVDAVYGEALGRTWRWLRSECGEETDFAIWTADGNGVRERLERLGPAAEALRRGNPPSPALLPAHLDILAQTSPAPHVEPDPHLFLHGKEDTSPDVQVVWRADLEDVPVTEWAEVVALCPPVTAEAMPVPLAEFRRWLAAGEEASGADVESSGESAELEENGPRWEALLWRGRESIPVQRVSDVGPGDTVVLRASATCKESMAALGHVPEGGDCDVAERARMSLRRRPIVRLHPAVIKGWHEPDSEQRQKLLAEAARDIVDASELRTAFEAYRETLPEGHWLRALAFSGRVEAQPYPLVDGWAGGWVLRDRALEADSGDDESSAGGAVELMNHLRDVAGAVRRLAGSLLGDGSLCERIVRAAEVHDIGKDDTRFQALLRGGDLTAARLAPVKLAKGRRARGGRERDAQYRSSGLPDGFRHELRSLSKLADSKTDDLVLHLVASHHGRCRPFAPYVNDLEERNPAHRLESGVAERYWRLTRRYGWWGLAYLETILRLGDWKASAEEVEA